MAAACHIQAAQDANNRIQHAFLNCLAEGLHFAPGQKQSAKVGGKKILKFRKHRTMTD